MSVAVFIHCPRHLGALGYGEADWADQYVWGPGHGMMRKALGAPLLAPGKYGAVRHEVLFVNASYPWEDNLLPTLRRGNVDAVVAAGRAAEALALGWEGPLLVVPARMSQEAAWIARGLLGDRPYIDRAKVRQGRGRAWAEDLCPVLPGARDREHSALLREVARAPGEAAPLLVLADWHEERGEAARARACRLLAGSGARPDLRPSRQDAAVPRRCGWDCPADGAGDALPGPAWKRLPHGDRWPVPATLSYSLAVDAIARGEE